MADSVSKMALDWHGDASKPLADLTALVNKQDAIIKGLKETNRAAKESKDAFDGIKGAASNILSLIGAGGGIVGAMMFLKSQADAWKETIKQAAAEYRNVQNEITKAIALSGELGNLKAIKDSLNKLYLPGVKGEERGQIFGAVSQAFPTGTIEQKIALTQQVGMGKAAYGNQLGAYATQIGTVADIYNGKLKEDDVADVTQALQKSMGGDVSRLQGPAAEQVAKMTANGAMDTTAALGWIVAASKANVSKEFGGLVNLMTSEKTFEPEVDPITGKRRTVSEKERVEMEFQSVAKNKRMDWLIANQGGKTNILAGGDAAGIGAVSQENAAAEAETLRRAMAENLAKKNLDIATKANAAMQKKYEREAYAQEVKERIAGGNQQVSDAQEVLDTYLTEQQGKGEWFGGRWAKRGIYHTLTAAGHDEKEALRTIGVPWDQIRMMTPKETGTDSENTAATKELTTAVRGLTMAVKEQKLSAGIGLMD